ncbi:hypothetical protein [Bacillus sp. PK3_68]|uniref:hypothetical protein n=1 Tax=Bacillus sp. PK3_68 TaxID=2027408 RepID=UPI000E723D9D|nr:hypothetical protein [Bacillus sp. PK3_68]RJS60096.1 hypothetical protein CJ483_08500 [Bacillus sp. PK3_68]
MIRSLEGVSTLDELEDLVFKQGYEIRCRNTGLMVGVAQPVPIDKMALHLSDGTPVFSLISELHPRFELVEAGRNRRGSHAIKQS